MLTVRENVYWPDETGRDRWTEKEIAFPRWPSRIPGREGPYKDYFYARIIRRVRPGLRLFGDQSMMPIFKFLHLMLVTKVYPHLFYWAWRARAYCSAFLCFLFILPPIATFLWLFVEEQNFTWETLAHTFTVTAKALHTYTDLKNLDVIYSQVLATVFFVPALIILLTSKCVFYLLPIAMLFAWDSVTSHGGELSDTEFHESRCNYWRKDVDDYLQKLIDEAEAMERNRP